MEKFQLICNTIVLIGAALGGLSAIMTWAGRPIVFFKRRVEKQKKENYDKMVSDVSNAVIKEISPRLEKIQDQNDQQNETTNLLLNSNKDLLRKSIVDLYMKNKEARAFTASERKTLDHLYEDYTAEHGNSYIQTIYERMITWEILPDEY